MRVEAASPAVSQSTRRSPARTPGAITQAAWLAEDVLVLAGWIDGDSRESEAIAFERPDGSLIDVAIGSIPANAERQTDAKVLVVCFPDAAENDAPLGRLIRRAKRGPRQLGPADVLDIITELKTLLRSAFTWLARDARAAVLEFLLLATAHAHRDGKRLSASLHDAREALRERLPRSTVAADRDHIVHLESALMLDDLACYVEGWVHTSAPDAELILVSPEGARIDVTHRLFRYPRPDVTEFLGLSGDSRDAPRPGFVCYTELPAPSRQRKGWLLELRHGGDRARVGVESRMTQARDDTEELRHMILGDLHHEAPPAVKLRTEHVMPAITRLQERLHRQIVAASVDQYGAPPAHPDVSVIVPLYHRLDFLEHQLAQFAHDPELHDADLIYVLDSPGDADALTSLATQLHRLYELPFRVVVLDRNGGFAAANNVGAQVARGRVLVLMNSDVLPDRPGWLAALRDVYDSTPAIGALAPKLLYEDGSIQHAGLFFDRPDGAAVWSNEHYFKGLAASLSAANVARPVPAVTGACMMISRELYERFGGLRGMYPHGDYEDSDLCLRLHAAGLSNWYVPHVQLYHLEGQSYPDELRRVASEYNAWVQTALWGTEITSIMRDLQRRPRGDEMR